MLESTVRSLAGFSGERAPVTTCYLDVDGRRHPRHADLERRAASVLREGRARLNGRADDESVLADLRRIEDWVRAGFDRRATRGLAFFSCTAHDLFEVVELPLPVVDRVVVNHQPAVAQLEAILRDHEPIAVLLADGHRTRVLVFELGELTDRSELFEELARGADHTHLRHAADVAWHLWQEHPFTHLAVGAPDPIASELEAVLHPYLRERLCGRLSLATAAPDSDISTIRAAALEIEHDVDRRREAAVVARLRDAAGSGGRGVFGLAATLQALNNRRVERLVVSGGYAEEGWRCPTSGALAAVGPVSPVTGERMERVDDVVEDAVEAALQQGAAVDVCAANADLDVAGRIGALLRY